MQETVYNMEIQDTLELCAAKLCVTVVARVFLFTFCDEVLV